ncbi:MAG: hypothetical protein ABI360_08495 [Allobranchiibius sp.]
MARLSSSGRAAVLRAVPPRPDAADLYEAEGRGVSRHQLTLDDLIGAPATGDPRVHLRPTTRYGLPSYR